MKISQLKKSDVDFCGYLLKFLKEVRYEGVGSEVENVRNCYSWVRDLAIAMADGWNEENMPKQPPEAPDAPRNVKIKNPPQSMS